MKRFRSLSPAAARNGMKGGGGRADVAVRIRSKSVDASTRKRDSTSSAFTSPFRRRVQSVPSLNDGGRYVMQDAVPSIMKISTFDESIHTQYSSSGRESSTTTTSSSRGRSSGRVSIRFGNVIIRQYPRDLGDNPSVTSGPPVSIAWDYTCEHVITVDEFDMYVLNERDDSEDFILRRDDRERLLLDAGISRKKIVAAIREVNKTKNRRRTTVNNLGRPTIVEEAVESGWRKFRRHVLRQKQQIEYDEEWVAEAHSAARKLREMAREERLEKEDQEASRGGVGGGEDEDDESGGSEEKTQEGDEDGDNTSPPPDFPLSMLTPPPPAGDDQGGEGGDYMGNFIEDGDDQPILAQESALPPKSNSPVPEARLKSSFKKSSSERINEEETQDSTTTSMVIGGRQSSRVPSSTTSLERNESPLTSSLRSSLNAIRAIEEPDDADPLSKALAMNAPKCRNIDLSNPSAVKVVGVGRS